MATAILIFEEFHCRLLGWKNFNGERSEFFVKGMKNIQKIPKPSFFLGLWVWSLRPWIVNLVSILFSDWSMLQLYYQFAQLVYRVMPEATVMQWPSLVPKNSWVPKNGRTCCTLPNWFLEFATTSTGWLMFLVSLLTAIQHGSIGNLACVCPVSFCMHFLAQTSNLLIHCERSIFQTFWRLHCCPFYKEATGETRQYCSLKFF